jgi:hypothetical protein
VNADGIKIKANHGHSFIVYPEPPNLKPPPYLFYGTPIGYKLILEREGIKPQKRAYVHMNDNFLPSYLLGGKSHKPATVFRIVAAKMYKDKFKFFKSDNGEWFTAFVPSAYIKEQFIEAYLDAPTDVIVSKTTIYTKLLQKEFDLENNARTVGIQHVWCYLCHRGNCYYEFSKDTVVCTELSYERNTLKHTLKGKFEHCSIEQNDHAIVVTKTASFTIPQNDIDRFRNSLGKDLDFEATGLRFKCPVCGQDFQSNLVRIEARIVCSGCNTPLLVLKLKTDIKVTPKF